MKDNNAIEFFSEDIAFEPDKADKIKLWLEQVVISHNFTLENLTYIFCSDNYLLQMNQDYLDHDTLTDIITFDNADNEGVVEGDIFISIDRVRENAAEHNVSFPDELCRVMAHGALHLMGFDDKSPELKAEMTRQENKALTLRQF
jgi:probable rRNA maturation factor